MAGGKLTPRQKMINLMYLVFIAMLAMNMSKEVLSAFGLMNEKFETSNKSASESNARSIAALDQKAAEAKGEFVNAAATAHKVEAATQKFFNFLGGLKADASKGTAPEEAKNYEAMDKADNLNETLFSGEGYTPRGKAVVAAFEAYKAEMKSALSDPKYATILKQVNDAFTTADVANKEGIKVKFLNYHFEGFPQIASVAKISAWQNDTKKFETDVINQALGKAAVDESSYSKFEAIVVLDKNAYFAGEQVNGKVVLGKYDPNAQFSDFQGPGKLVNGQAILSMTAGGVGEQSIGGSFNFVENGKPIKLPFKGSYVVVPKPNSATISADKMNVVYRGVSNPISVSFAGIGSDKVQVNAPGISKGAKAGQFNLNPGSGNTVMITAVGTLNDGTKVTDKKEFRIKGLPSPTGKIRGEVAAKGAKSNLEVCTITAEMEDFDFPVSVNVKQFNIKVPGQPTIVVSGNKMDARAKAAIAKAGRGDVVLISEIKADFVGIDQVPKRVSQCSFEIN